jgi:hypothetical protein
MAEKRKQNHIHERLSGILQEMQNETNFRTPFIESLLRTCRIISGLTQLSTDERLEKIEIVAETVMQIAYNMDVVHFPRMANEVIGEFESLNDMPPLTPRFRPKDDLKSVLEFVYRHLRKFDDLYENNMNATEAQHYSHDRQVLVAMQEFVVEARRIKDNLLEALKQLFREAVRREIGAKRSNAEA